MRRGAAFAPFPPDLRNAVNATAETPFRIPPHRPRTVLVLGGGGMKGTAHVGVWKALEDTGVRIDAIVGCSIGSLIGAAIAGGHGWRELAEIARALTKDDIVKINKRAVWMGGVREEAVFDGAHYRDWIERHLPLTSFADARMPIRINAVSLVSCGEVWFGTEAREDVHPVDAVYASCAVPLYYPPLRLDGDVLADGGVLNVLPIDQAFAWGADRVIAVDVGAELQPPGPDHFSNGMLAIHDRVTGMNLAAQRRRNLETYRDAPVLFIRPRIGHLGTWDFARTQYFLEEGYRATREALKALEAA